MYRIFTIATLLLTFVSCNDASTTSGITTKENNIEATHVSAPVIDTAQMRLDSLQDIEDQKKLVQLEKKFYVKTDEFKGLTFYKHKNWSKDYFPNRKTIYPYFNSSGSMFLVTNYYGDDWLFHTEAIVIIDGSKFATSTVETYEDLHKTDNDGGMVWENVTHVGDEDKALIKAIANNVDKEIKVRMQGDQWYKDFTLSAKDKQAIKDVWQLYNLKFD